MPAGCWEGCCLAIVPYLPYRWSHQASLGVGRGRWGGGGGEDCRGASLSDEQMPVKIVNNLRKPIVNVIYIQC